MVLLQDLDLIFTVAWVDTSTPEGELLSETFDLADGETFRVRVVKDKRVLH